MQSANLAKPASSLNKPLSDDLLTAFHPLIKQPLPDWIQSILDYLNLFLSEKENLNYKGISVCFKQSALIAFHFGQAENAFKLCYGHLDWLSRVVAQTGRLELAQEGFDSWLNFGRLERLLGHNDKSLQYFEELANSPFQNEVNFASLTLTPAHWEAIKLSWPEYDNFIRHNYMTDTLKTLFKAKSYDKVLELVANEFSRPDSQINPGVLIEAKFVALCKLGQPSEALALAEQEASNKDNPKLRRLIFNLRRAEALAYFEDPVTATKLAGELGLMARLFEYDKEPRLLKSTLSLRVAKLLAGLGQKESALKLAEDGYRAASVLRDEPLQLDYLVTLSDLTTETDQWRETLKQHANLTCYKMWRDRLPNKTEAVTQTRLEECGELMQTLFNLLMGLAN